MSDELQRSSAKERGKRLRLVRKMSGLTLDELSSKYSFGISTIKYWECAKNQGLSSKGAKKIISAMQDEGVQCSYMWLMHGIGLPPQFLDVHYNKGDKTNIGVDQANFEEEKSIEHEIKLFCEKIIDAIALTVFDDGMEPFYSVSDGVGGKRLYGNELTKAIGKNCIVETVDRQLLCRRVAEGNSPDNYNLYCINPGTVVSPPHLYDVKLLSAAPISRIWRRMVF
ncbi:MAG: helix-turn-helix domain-containing protein [Gammaproteobacteria bacterium]|nr:helix-turn-helix domain-containing protein [Gammaproteobacteria bacterium]